MTDVALLASKKKIESAIKSPTKRKLTLYPPTQVRSQNENFGGNIFPNAFGKEKGEFRVKKKVCMVVWRTVFLAKFRWRQKKSSRAVKLFGGVKSCFNSQLADLRHFLRNLFPYTKIKQHLIWGIYALNHNILLKMTFNWNYLGAHVKFWGAIAPPVYVPAPTSWISKCVKRLANLNNLAIFVCSVCRYKHAFFLSQQFFWIM